MSLDFINRIIKTSLIFVLIVFPFAAVYVGLAFGVSIVLGCLWACTNLFLIRYLVTGLLGEGPKKKYLILATIFIKFPLLYFLGYLMVKWSYLSVYGLLWGFSAIFVVTVLKVISRSLLKLDDKPARVI
jgi:hypothetical protein